MRGRTCPGMAILVIQAGGSNHHRSRREVASCIGDSATPDPPSHCHLTSQKCLFRADKEQLPKWCTLGCVALPPGRFCLVPPQELVTCASGRAKPGREIPRESSSHRGRSPVGDRSSALRTDTLDRQTSKEEKWPGPSISGPYRVHSIGT